MNDYISLMMRAFLIMFFLAVLMIVGEFFFVFVMRFLYPDLPFTSFYAVALFAVISGFLPLQPSPSRLSLVPLGFWARIILVAEISIFVALALYASSMFMAYKQVFVPIEITFPAYGYLLVLLVMLVGNSRKLRDECVRVR